MCRFGDLVLNWSDWSKAKLAMTMVTLTVRPCMGCRSWEVSERRANRADSPQYLLAVHELNDLDVNLILDRLS